MEKKVVYYRDNYPTHIVVGSRALCRPIDHPNTEKVSNSRPVLTSVVLNFDKETGIFETENTIYKPSKGGFV